MYLIKHFIKMYTHLKSHKEFQLKTTEFRTKHLFLLAKFQLNLNLKCTSSNLVLTFYLHYFFI